MKVVLRPPPRPDVLKHSLGFRGGATSVGGWIYGGYRFTTNISNTHVGTATRPASTEHTTMGVASPSGVFHLVGIGQSDKGFDVTIGAIWTAISGDPRCFVGLALSSGFTEVSDTPKPYIGFVYRPGLGANWFATCGESIGPSSASEDTGVAFGLGTTANPWLFRMRRVLTGPVTFSLNGVDVATIASSIPINNFRVIAGQQRDVSGTGTFRFYGHVGYGTP